ncbi:MAG TPA: DUF4238 domain-containing protein [Pseudobdellovibrionaceae bacterium]|nr:DUF4238 domain-containing protein [Pseudobdellovibrionaceae bacterium]
MSKQIDQHYIPRVYLKWFQIDSVENKSFVYCIDFSNKFNTKVQRKGLNDPIFKKKKFYNDSRLIDPFSIEDVLGKEFEPKYDSIIKSLEFETSPSTQTVEDLMTWLYISKLRSPYFRSNTERVLDKIISITNAYKQHVPTEKEKAEIDLYIKRKSREVHLNPFSNKKQAQELLNLHFETLNGKHWRILKSRPEFPFWTNDNPGFSPNRNPMFAKDNPFHQVMELNENSIILYVLTPRYCLELTPFEEGTPHDVCAFNMKINFEQASLELIDYINQGVFYSRYKLIISNSKELLETCVKIKPK